MGILRPLTVMCTLVVLGLVVFPSTALAGPGTIVVNTTADVTTGSACSLRAAIIAANTASAAAGCAAGVPNSTNTIQVPAGSYNLDGSQFGRLVISSNITISGAGARSTDIRGYTVGQRVFEISSGTVEIDGVTIEGGSTLRNNGAETNSGVGGGIWVNSGASLTLQDSTVMDNEADISGGGIDNNGSLTIVRSTIENNTTGTGGFGGGIDDFGASLSITNSTIMQNTAQTDGGGLFISGPSTLRNDTIANNTSATGGQGGSGSGIAASSGIQPLTISLANTLLAQNISGATDQSSNCSDPGGGIASIGHNLADDSTCGLTASGDQVVATASLSNVDNVIGPTDVIPLLPGSPAIDAGADGLSCPTVDQRGVSRPQGAHCDIGAYEFTPQNDYFVSTPQEVQEASQAADDNGVPATIHLAAGHYDVGNTVGTEFSFPEAAAPVTFKGAGASSTVLDGDGSTNEIFQLGGNDITTIEGVTVENSTDTGIVDNGDLKLADSVVQNNTGVGIQSTNAGLDISGSTISGNGNAAAGVDAQFNGGIFSEAPLSIVNSTIAGNQGSGVYVDSGGSAAFQNVTIAANPGVGLDLRDTGTAVNTIVAANTAGDCTTATAGDWTSEHNNLDKDNSCGFVAPSDWPEVDPQLGPLQDNGGPTPTMGLPGTASEAVDHGDALSCPGVDQRGTSRPQGPQCDIGAFEFVPSSFVVTNANDTGLGSLREIINEANAANGGLISFNIPGGPAVITLSSPLPPITGKVSIDGSTPAGPGVTIVPGVGFTQGALLDLTQGSNGSTVHGLAFGGGVGNTGTTAIRVESNSDTITGNWIGTAANSAPVAVPTYGIQVSGSHDTIGGGTAGATNVLTGSVQDAVSIAPATGGPAPVGNVIQGNLVGFEPNGTPASGQGNGISVSGSIGTIVGNNDGPSGLGDVQQHPELGNVISGMGDAIDVVGGSTGTIVAGNFIGVDRGGAATGLNADGIVVLASSGNQIGPGDTIAHATHDGVAIVGGSAGDRIVANSIFDSAHLGIDLQSGNDNLVAPTITSVSPNGTISGTWAGNNPAFIEVFTNPSCNAPFATGSGKTYTFDFITAQPGQPWSTQLGGLTNGEGVTVTATDLSTLDTSEFSNCVAIGQSIAFESNRVNSTSQIFTMNPDGSNVTQLTHDPTGTTDTLPSISPDGHTVVYQSNASGTDQIWAIDGDGGNPRQLTTDHTNRQPTFSPDGTKIAFDSNRNGNFQLFVMNADGTGQTQVMTTDGNVGGSSWSPDGSQIAFNDDTNGTNQIYTVDVGTGTVTGPLTTSGANSNPHWSPDGSEILFVSTRCDPFGLAQAPTCGGGASVFLMNANGTNQHNLTQAPIFDADPAWSPGGTHIAFVRDLTGQNFNVFTANADGTNQVQLTNGSAPSRNSFPNWGTTVSAPTSVLSNLTVNVTPSSAGAGIDQVLISTIPNAWLSFLAGSTTSTPVGSTPVGSTPVGSTPVGSTPVGSTPVGSTPVGSTPVGSTPVGSTPVGSTGLLDLPVGSTPVGSTPVGSTALSSLLLSQIPLCGDVRLPGTNQAACQSDGATWAQVLAGISSLADQPLNALTLADVVGNATAKGRLAALPLKDVSFATTLFRSVHWSSLLLGSTPLSALPGGFSAWCGADGKIPDSGGSCTNATPDTSVLQMDVAGQLGSAPVGSTPVGSTLFLASPVGSTPVGSTPVGSTDIPVSKLSLIPVSSLPSGIVTCTTCTTLGDAFRANAISPTAKFADIADAMQAQGITINDILVAILGAAGFPWEQLSIQGLQPYSATPSQVTYTVGTQVECSAAPQFTITAALPRGFFPVNGSAQFAVGNNAPQAAGDPTVLGNSVAAAAKNNAYKWTVNCPAGDTAQEAATLTFDSWVGLELGTFTTHVTAATATASISTNGAPVKVHQNPEAGDLSTATEIQPDKLIVGHIAFSGEQAFYKVKLDGLPRGTRIQAFLNVPSGADLDLTMSAPTAPSFFSTPVGSTPVGSTPIEDSPVGFSSSGLALPPDTLQDVPVGSTPVGSTPVGSTPVGSTSANRGDGVNEAGGIITTGQGGYATIGVSGYNGASSNDPFVLRVQETPPPPLPNCPARNLTVSPANQGTLPSSLPTSTKTVFLVDKQRLMAMYPAADVNNMLTALGTLAARSEVSGSILYVDGDQGVRNAYSAWDAAPCDTTARNNVVKAINDVVASYRNSATGLPNLHYIVLVGSDEAGPPMANTFDPVLLSPEENEASDLAFTTSGLTNGNALYASAAQNNILTDGAYGAFTNIPWLDRSLLLPQVSVSRLVETPNDILGQVNRYLGNNGISAPQTAAGTLNPTTALVTGYDFLADGAAAVNANLKANFTGLSSSDNFSAGVPTINNPGADWKRSTTYAAGAIVQPITGNPSGLTFTALNSGISGDTPPTWSTSLVGTTSDNGITWQPTVAPWHANDVLTSALQSSNPPSIVSLDAHYNQYELEAAAGDLANSGQANSPNLAARILFTMGCHGGLNIADTLGGTTGKYLDWPELYAQKQAAMYIANTGYGYGDTASVALSERLLALFAKNLHSDSGSVGEEWVNALQQYFATAGAYDVYDEKVMEETTFYGLPFWHFSAAGSSPTFTPLTTSVDPLTGTQSANVTFPTSATTQSQFGLYRPVLPITSQQVTSSLPARGVWVKNLSSTEFTKDAIIGYPTIDLSAHEPAPGVSPIFFPASPFTLEHSLAFGTERDYLNVSDQFRPTGSGNAGVQRHFTGGTFEVFYSQSADQVAPLISQVNVSKNGTLATVTARVTSDSGSVAEVAALVNDGTWHYLQLSKSPLDPTLWTGTITVSLEPEVFVEATDGVNVSYSANKGLNFTSTNSNAPPSGVQILLQAPVGPYAQGQAVNATYQCGSAAAQCIGTVPSGSPIDTTTFGVHTFVVQALDADGNVLGSLQRTYVVQFPFNGFFAPVDNQPVINVTKAGSAIPVIFSLGGNQGLNIFATGFPKSQTIACDSTAPADGIDSTLTAGGSSLSYDSGSGRYTYIWKTDKSWAGTCRALILKMQDGTTHRADFKFK